MTFEPIDSVRPAATNGDSHPVWTEPDTNPPEATVPEVTVIGQRQPEEIPSAAPAVEDGHAHAEVVRALLRASGLNPSAAETEALIADFWSVRAAVRTLYGVPEARYADPGLVFRAAP